MTLEEYKKLQAATHDTRRLHHTDEEHRLQVQCVAWFRRTYPRLSHTLFAVPNGGRRDAQTGARLKEEGVLAGVADLILLKSNRHYGALLIEMKTPTGRQSTAQRTWASDITREAEYKYILCRSIPQFQREVRAYLSDVE